MSNVAVLRVHAVRRGGVAAMGAHNARTQTEQPAHIDPARTQYNKILRGSADPAADLMGAIEGVVMARRDRDPSHEAVGAEIIMSASPAYFAQCGPDLGPWAQASLNWLDREYPGRVVNAVVHLDEQTPHIHAVLRVDVDHARRKPGTDEMLPAQRRINYSALFGDSLSVIRAAKAAGTSHIDTKLGRMQTSYAQSMAHLGLERGIESARTHRKINYVAPDVYRTAQIEIEEMKQNAQKEAMSIINAAKAEAIKSVNNAADAIMFEKERAQKEIKELNNQINKESLALIDKKEEHRELMTIVRQLRNDTTQLRGQDLYGPFFRFDPKTCAQALVAIDQTIAKKIYNTLDDNTKAAVYPHIMRLQEAQKEAQTQAQNQAQQTPQIAPRQRQRGMSM